MEGVILLSTAVKDILFKTKTPSSEYFRYMALAAEAVTELRLYDVSYPKQRKVQMNESGIISFPQDMIKFMSIGMAKDGRLWTYTHAGDMLTVTEIEDGVKVPIEKIPPQGNEYGPSVRGGKNTHYVKVDYEQRLIFVMGYPVQDAYLTYTSSGIDIHTPTFIPVEMTPVIAAYIKWADSKYDKDVSGSDKDRNEYYFHQQRNKLKSLRWPTTDQWADVIRRTYSRSVIR